MWPGSTAASWAGERQNGGIRDLRQGGQVWAGCVPSTAPRDRHSSRVGWLRNRCTGSVSSPHGDRPAPTTRPATQSVFFECQLVL